MRSNYELHPFRSKHVYEFVDIVYAAVHGQDGFDDEAIFQELFANISKISKPHKDTLLHDLIQNICTFYLEYSTGHSAEDSIEYYSSLLEEAEIRVPKWLTKNSVCEHIHSLDKLLAKASKVITPSVFYVLFFDREFLLAFQKRVAAYVKILKFIENDTFLIRNGVLKRPKYIPTWLKAGVFYRDRGRYQHCQRNLSGLNRPVRDLNIDHIIPLAKSGSNDPSNFQLLCNACNLIKGMKFIHVPQKYTPYW